MDKNKESGQVLIDLRNKFREATSIGILSGEQKAIFELTMISILNESEEQRQRCLKLKQQHEREAARAEAQAASFQTTQNLIYTVFGSIIGKIKQSQAEVEEAQAEKEDLSDSEMKAIKEIEKRQIAKEKQTQRRDVRKGASKKTTKKTTS